MAERDEFGPNLRAARVRRGMTIARLAEVTKVGSDLWEGLERNDLSRWPTGLYARAYVRAYALEVGLDPETTVDEFCRCFPAGDRRAGRLVRENAALLGHESKWEDDLAHIEADRRATPSDSGRAPAFFTKRGRIVAAAGDAAAVLLAATAASALLSTRWALAAAVLGLAYHAASLLALGCTPAAWAIDTYLTSRHPSTPRSTSPRFLRLIRGSERAKA
jgi:transcriptional regulator with XRE-family HTH domain